MRIDLRVMMAAALTLAAGPVQAQTNQEVNAAIQFNFSNPGARSLSMGGSLTGLADDATAALTNPSALPLLPAPEISGEFRGFGFSTPYTASGSSVPPLNIGINTVTGLVFNETADDAQALSFFSFVLPRERWGLAVYGHQVSKLEANVETDGAFVASASTAPIARLLPVSATMDLSVASWGVSGAVKVSEQFFLGGGVSFATLDLSSRTDRFCLCLTGSSATQPGGTFGPPLKTDANTRFSDYQEGSGTSPAFNVGVTVRANPRFSLGASYRQGAKFDEVDIRVDLGPAAFATDQPLQTTGRFKVPDVFSFGVVAKPNLVFREGDVLRLAGEVRHVTYSDLTDDFVLSVATGDNPSNYVVDDGQEIRLGAEYLFVSANTLALRGGAWRDPDHRIAYTGSLATAAASFRPGSDEWHYTVGAGVSIGRHAQLDAGYDHAATITTFSISFVARF